MPLTPFQLAEKARKNAMNRKKAGQAYFNTRASNYKNKYVKPVSKSRAPSKASAKMRNKEMEKERVRRELREELDREAEQRRIQEEMRREAERKRSENERKRAENEQNKELKKIYTMALNALKLRLVNNTGAYEKTNPANVRTNTLLRKLIAAKIHPNKVTPNKKNMYERAFKKYGPFLFPNTRQNFRN